MTIETTKLNFNVSYGLRVTLWINRNNKKYFLYSTIRRYSDLLCVQTLPINMISIHFHC